MNFSFLNIYIYIYIYSQRRGKVVQHERLAMSRGRQRKGEVVRYLICSYSPFIINKLLNVYVFSEIKLSEEHKNIIIYVRIIVINLNDNNLNTF